MLRLAFLGSSEISVIALRSLLDAGHDVSVVVTGPDRRRGRGGAASPSPVKLLAMEASIPVGERPADAVRSGAELGVVVAFGQLIRPPALEAMPFVNLHFSLLPRWRGAAPVERAILAGDEVTGVSLMKIDEGLDTGAVLAERAVAIRPHETASSLRHRLATEGAQLLVEQLAAGLPTMARPRPQRGDVTYADKIRSEELQIDWQEAAERIERLVRIGKAWTTWRGARMIVWDGRAIEEGPCDVPPGQLRSTRVATGDGWFDLLEVQPAGRGSLAASDWRRGARPSPGERLGVTPAADGSGHD